MAASDQVYFPGTLDQRIASVREAIGVNRLAIFLDDHFYTNPTGLLSAKNGFSCAGAIGVPAEIRDHSKLSRNSGIGGWITRHGTILRRKEAGSILPPFENRDVQQEFESLNCQFAVPITDRRNTIGVALIDAPISRPEFDEQELQKIFHLMEKLGLFIKKNRDDARLSFDNFLLNQMLAILHCGVLVITRELEVVKANSAAKGFFGIDSEETLSFDRVPEVLAEQIRGAVSDPGPQAPFFLSFPSDPLKRLLRITLSPIVHESINHSHPVMVTLEDFSDVEAARRAVFDTAASRIATQLQLLTGT